MTASSSISPPASIPTCCASRAPPIGLILVTTEEPTALTDAYAMVKLLRLQGAQGRCRG